MILTTTRHTTTVATTRRNYQTQAVQSQAIQSQAIQSQAIQSQAIQSQGAKQKLVESSKLVPDATLETQRFNLTIRRRVAPSTGSSNPQLVIQSQHSNRGVQLNQTTPLLTAALSSRNTIPLATGSSILRLVILSSATTARRNTSATTAFPFHQLQATVTIKFQILPVVGYSTVDSIFGGIRQLLIFEFTWLIPNNEINQ
ncbi:hypothetical protein F511_39484 [Dorcoceras hygrometricum]|uniref:Uncharacterized protein n=1 Tax=Dorcoceras hygrometricum TaxID=472368 RepID=A0A2Z7C8J3_9LAMI|nr:hypothetical protein F511_39484 [Dorcoceras hygrometricum]